MERIEVFGSKMRDGATVPAYATDRASGVDLCALVDGPVVLGPMERSPYPDGHLHRNAHPKVSKRRCVPAAASPTSTG